MGEVKDWRTSTDENGVEYKHKLITLHDLATYTELLSNFPPYPTLIFSHRSGRLAITLKWNDIHYSFASKQEFIDFLKNGYVVISEEDEEEEKLYYYGSIFFWKCNGGGLGITKIENDCIDCGGFPASIYMSLTGDDPIEIESFKYDEETQTFYKTIYNISELDYNIDK